MPLDLVIVSSLLAVPIRPLIEGVAVELTSGKCIRFLEVRPYKFLQQIKIMLIRRPQRIDKALLFPVKTGAA